ncbi:hypothetical protein CRE_17506 [Caenorhabditis remanei]|uniref:Integrase catalytic domain-containing protein n=1 Tax=Caenorhabditis remanei TaxID=31234 RepID=E3N7S1_CAERE|nr:hypothetical protein CRE_17506 [Caenorhabditis remanei]
MANKNKKKSEKRNPVTMKTIKWSVTRELTRTRTLVSLADRALALERNTQNITVLDGYLAQLLDQLALIEGLQENAMEMLKSNKKLCTQNVFEANRAEISNHLAGRGYDGLVNQITNLIGELTSAVNNARPGNVSTPGTPPPPPSDGPASGNSQVLDGIAPNQEHPERRNPEQSVQTASDQSDQLRQGVVSNSGRHPPNSTKPCESNHSSDVSAHPTSNILNRGSSEASQDIAEFADDLAVRIGAIEHTQTLLLDSSATANRAIKNLQDHMQTSSDTTDRAIKNLQENMQKLQDMMYEVFSRQSSWQNKPEMKQEETESATMSEATKPSSGQPDASDIGQSSPIPLENSSPLPPASTPMNDTVESPIRRQNHPGSQDSSNPQITNSTVYTVMNTVPVFDGEPADYSMFMQLFNSMVHDKDDIPVTLKHALLMKLLSGKVKSMLRSVSLSEEDYHALRDSLERQYNREKDTKQGLIHQLNKFSFSEDSYEDMEQDLNTYCTIAYSLRSKGCTLNDSFFINSFISKLPQQIMGIVFKKNHEKDRTFQELVGITFNKRSSARTASAPTTALKSATRNSFAIIVADVITQVFVKTTERTRTNPRMASFFEARRMEPPINKSPSSNHKPLKSSTNGSSVTRSQSATTSVSLSTLESPAAVTTKSLEVNKPTSSLAKINTPHDQLRLVNNAEESNSESMDIGPGDDNESFQIYVSRGIEEDSKLPFMTLVTPEGHTLLALADCGASTSLISTQTATKLKLRIVGQRNLRFKGLISETRDEECKFYRLEIADQSKNVWAATVASYGGIRIPFTAPNLSPSEYKQLDSLKFNTTKIKDLQQFNGRPIDIILGNNLLGNIHQQLITLDSGRMVTRTVIGSIIYPSMVKNALVPVDGKKPIVVTDDMEHIVVHTLDTPDYDLPEDGRVDSKSNVSNQKLAKQVEQHWNLDLLGIEPPEIVNSKARLNEHIVEQQKQSSIRDENNLISATFPYNGREQYLDDNFPIALQRLVSLTKGQTMDTRMEYDTIIRKQIDSGIVEIVTTDMKPSGPIFYFPHRGVRKESSVNTKLRIVLDASSHGKGKLSLNDCIHPGPSILQSIFGILIRCRLKKFLMISDIEKAFHQIRLQPQCRDSTRFLWLKDPTKDATPDNILVLRFARLPFGVNCSPFLLAVTILQYLENEPNPINAKILENLYVDNIVMTTNDEDELFAYYDQLKNTFNRMAMNLREFLCNCPEVMEKTKEDDRAPDTANKLLGHTWDSLTDVISIKIATPPNGIPTKKEVIAFLAQNYDPTGIITPIVVPIKKLITLLWQFDLKWSDLIPDVLTPLWNSIITHFTETEYVIPRQVVSSYNYTGVQLVLFSDASKDNYAAAAYLRHEFPGQKYESQLICSKSRVKPGRVGITIPQMELLALESATNLALNLMNELHMPIKQVIFFSDSTCVLHWVLHKVGNHVGLKWVANRVTNIHKNLAKLTELQLNPEMRYVPTNANPADIASRGCTLAELKVNKLWHHGPSFLERSGEDWPQTLETAPPDARMFHLFVVRDGEEVLSRELHQLPKQESQETAVVNSMEEKENGEYESIVPYSRTNDMRKLTTTCNYVLRFVHSCIKKRNNRFPTRQYSYQSKTLQKYDDADKENDEVTKRRITRTFIIADHYRDSKHRMNEEPPAHLKPVLTPEGLYRHSRPYVNSRHPRHSDEMKRPIIIIHKHQLARLLVIESHTSLLHQGVKDVISDIQRKYWITKLGVIVRAVRRQCVTCQRMHARPFEYPYSETLPSIRSQLVAPFAFVGLDYLGPLKYKSKDEYEKIWVLLVTCIVTRAVHLEIVQDNTTHSFILALKRYFGRRGVPQSILSDNSPTFKLGYSMMNADLKTLISKSLTLTSFLADKEIDIRFITPFSPWKGGIYERLVALVKNMIHKCLKKITVSLLELESLLIETECIINCRPITANKIHTADAEPVRPIDYLIPQSSVVLPESSKTISEVLQSGKTEKLTRRLIESTAAVRDNLWNVFSDEYYVLLRESIPRSAAHNKNLPTPGTTVLIVTDKVARYMWPIGVIQKLISSKDGKVRAVEVKIGQKTFQKSVNHLIPLEIPTEDNQDQDKSAIGPPDTQQQMIPASIPPRRTRPYLPRRAKENNVTIGHDQQLGSPSNPPQASA